MWKLLPFKLIDVLVGITKLLTGATAIWHAPESSVVKQRIYFANHTSNLDTIVIWSCLPFKLRQTTRPVAAKDYWDKPGIRRHIATQELNVVFVERQNTIKPIEVSTPIAPPISSSISTSNSLDNLNTTVISKADPLDSMREALRSGDSLIIFPEGQRNNEIVPGAFKSGLYKLSKEFPQVELVPIYLENVAKTFPRGAPAPLPIICKVHVGKPFKFEFDETGYIDERDTRREFLQLARLSVIELIPPYMRKSMSNFEDEVKNPPTRDS